MKHQYQTFEGLDPMMGAVLDIIGSAGLGAVRSREIARLSGQSAASVTRRFGSQDGLVREALLLGADRECRRLEALVPQLRDLTLRGELKVDAVIAVLNQTHFAEPQAAAFRWTVFAHEDGPLVPDEATSKLTDCLDELWSQVAVIAGLSEQDGSILHHVLEGFGRGHLITQNPIIFRGWSHDVCRRLISRLSDGRPSVGQPGWREQLGQRASDVDPSEMASFPAKKAAIVEVAAACLASKPLATITHRSIAREAGVSLSSMTHYFRSLEEVLWLGCLRMVTNLVDVDDGGRLTSQIQSLPEFVQGFKRISLSPAAEKLDRLEQLQLYCHHTESFRKFGDPFLLRQGQNSEQILNNISDLKGEYDRLDAVMLHNLSLAGSKSIRREMKMASGSAQAAAEKVGKSIDRLFG